MSLAFSSAEDLSEFKGVKRRLEYIGRENDIVVIDDFAHNPDKIAASLSALRQSPGRLIVIFQPHGFGPMKMMRREITSAFSGGMATDDILILSDIFYAGEARSGDRIVVMGARDDTLTDFCRDILADAKARAAPCP